MKFRDEEWYLYHHYKNENPLIFIIILTLFFCICNGGIFYIIITWSIYLSYCKHNNDILNNNPDILRKREEWKRYHEKYDK